MRCKNRSKDNKFEIWQALRLLVQAATEMYVAVGERTVWPNLAKLSKFGKIFKIFVNLEFGKILNLLLRKFSFLTIAKYWKITQSSGHTERELLVGMWTCLMASLIEVCFALNGFQWVLLSWEWVYTKRFDICASCTYITHSVSRDYLERECFMVHVCVTRRHHFNS